MKKLTIFCLLTLPVFTFAQGNLTRGILKTGGEALENASKQAVKITQTRAISGGVSTVRGITSSTLPTAEFQATRMPPFGRIATPTTVTYMEAPINPSPKPIDLQRIIMNAFILSQKPHYSPVTQEPVILNLESLFTGTLPNNLRSLSSEAVTTIARKAAGQVTCLNGKEELMYLMINDPSSEFFKTSFVKNGKVFIEVNKKIDIADSQHHTFFTLQPGTLIQMEPKDLHQAHLSFGRLTEVEAASVRQRIQTAARSGTGKRQFLFVDELEKLLEENTPEHAEFFGPTVQGKLKNTTTHLSFVPVQKPLDVLTDKGLRTLQPGMLINLSALRLDGDMEVYPFQIEIVNLY